MKPKQARRARSIQWPPAPGGDPLASRALRKAEVKPAGLWTRHSWTALRGALLAMQEVFLPSMSRP